MKQPAVHYNQCGRQKMPLCHNISIWGRDRASYTKRQSLVTCRSCQKVIHAKVKQAFKTISKFAD